MANDADKVCAVVKCPPLKVASGDFVGMTIAQLRKDKRVRDEAEVADGAPPTVSKDRGKTFYPPEHFDKDITDGEQYIVKDQDVVEFARGSSTKG